MQHRIVSDFVISRLLTFQISGPKVCGCGSGRMVCFLVRGFQPSFIWTNYICTECKPAMYMCNEMLFTRNSGLLCIQIQFERMLLSNISLSVLYYTATNQIIIIKEMVLYPLGTKNMYTDTDVSSVYRTTSICQITMFWHRENANLVKGIINYDAYIHLNQVSKLPFPWISAWWNWPANVVKR